MKIEEHLLENGATVIGVPIQGVKTVTVFFGFRTGSRSENVNNMGTAHFLEHMAFQGSKKRPSQKKITTAADRIGARFNAGTNKEYTFYYIQTTKENFDLAADIVGDMVSAPIFDPNSFNKERGAILEELHRVKDSPEDDIFRLMELNFFGDNSMGWEIIGTEESLNSLTIGDLKKYYKEKYVTENLTVVVAGDLPDNYLQIVRPYIDLLPIGEISFWEQALYSENKVLVSERETAQAQISVMIPAFGITDPRRNTLRVIANILGGYMSSRLFTEVRDKHGWAYFVSAFAEMNTDNGYLGVIGGIKKDKVEETIKIIKDQILNLAVTVTDEEVERAIGNLKGTSVIRYESVSQRGLYVLLSNLVGNKIETPEDSLLEIEQVTKEDVVTLCEELFHKERLYLTLVGLFAMSSS